MMLKDQIFELEAKGVDRAAIAKIVGCHPAYVRAALSRARVEHRPNRSSQQVLPGAPDYKSQPSPPRTTFADVSASGWSGEQEFVAAFLAKRNNPPERIAEIVNRPVHEVERFLGAA